MSMKNLMLSSVLTCLVVININAEKLPDGVTRHEDGSLWGLQTMTVPANKQGKNLKEIKITYLKDGNPLKDKIEGNIYFAGCLSRLTRPSSYIFENVIYPVNGVMFFTFDGNKTTIQPGADKEYSAIPAGYLPTSMLDAGTYILYLKQTALPKAMNVFGYRLIVNGKNNKAPIYGLCSADTSEIKINENSQSGEISVTVDGEASKLAVNNIAIPLPTAVKPSKR